MDWLGERGHTWWRYLAAGIAVPFILFSIIARAQNGAGRGDKEKADYRAAMETADQKIAAEVQARAELVKKRRRRNSDKVNKTEDACRIAQTGRCN